MTSPSSSSKNIPVRGRRESPTPSTNVGNFRHASITRLGSPIRGGNSFQSPSAAYLSALSGGTPPRYGTPPRQTATPPPTQNITSTSPPGSTYGSFDPRNSGLENPEIVRRHLVSETRDQSERGRSSGRLGGAGLDDEQFNSLQLQGGDITRQIYQWDAEQRDASERRGRSKSFILPRPQPEDDTMNINNIKVPGGFRRNFIRRAVAASPSGQGRPGVQRQPTMLTQNFIEFLSIYGHFAGEELEEEEYASGDEGDDQDDLYEGEEEHGESSALLGSGRGRRKQKMKTKREMAQGKGGVSNAILLLLKSFVGTGVLFLPKAFLNGGLMFCILLLLFVAGLSYYCFVLLIKTRLKVAGSYGDMGGILFGPVMKFCILFSIVVSQIGFASAYIVFVSENLQAFILAVSKCRVHIEVRWLILMQMVVFLPFSMIRDISKLGGTALVADFFILLGLIYLYYYDFFTLATEGVADIVQFNKKDWTLFIGTAIFTFEGIGLIIPIQESMKKPQKFPAVLGGVMILITIIFTSMGALSYMAFGSSTKTVVLLNLPQNSKFVNGVQFLYSLAILLSTPLQLFPAIRIIENGLFVKSGKYSNKVKWEKNVFRFCLVIVTAIISWGGSDDLDKFVALTGSFACVPLVYMYPALLHMRACATRRITKIADIALFIFGLAVMVYTTQQTVRDWASGGSKAKPLPGYCPS